MWVSGSLLTRSGNLLAELAHHSRWRRFVNHPRRFPITQHGTEACCFSFAPYSEKANAGFIIPENDGTAKCLYQSSLAPYASGAELGDNKFNSSRCYDSISCWSKAPVAE
jgi:hypothetical protein